MPGETSVSFLRQADQVYQPSLTDNDNACFTSDEIGRVDEGSIISALPETVDSSSLGYGLEMEQRVRRQSTPQKFASYLVFDMRGRKNYVEGESIRLPVDLKQAIRTLKASLSDIHRTSRKVGGSQVLVLGEDVDKYLLVKTASDTRCMRFKKASPAKTVTEELNKIRSFAAEKHSRVNMREAQLYHSRFWPGRLREKNRESNVGDDSFAVLYNKKPIEISEVLGLPKFAMVEIVEVVLVEWHIFDRYKPLCDVRYIVKSSTMDSLSAIKQKFMDCYSEVQERGKMSIETVWLTQESTLVSDILVQGTYNVIARYRRNTEEMVRQCKTGSALRLKQNPHDNSICIDEVYVQFPMMPKDALEIEVNFKEHVSYCSLLVISPEISRDKLRAEVSKVVQQKPNRIRISVGGHKLDSNINLRDVICSPGCKIAVTPKSKISLHVRLVFVPPQPGEEGDCNIELSVFSYDMMHMLKDELYNQAGILGHTVDLYFDERLLADDTTFSDNRIRDRDLVEARVFPNRVKLLARMPNKQWYHLLVDNCFDFTVGQVKSFAQSLQEVGSIHSCELMAIARDRVVSDTELLGDLFPERCPLPRLVVVQVESMCFTADTAHKGTFAVCRSGSTESTSFQQVLAMYNGESLFYGAEVTKEDGKVSEMLEKRRHAPRTTVQVPGIRIVPCHQKQDSTPEQSPEPPTRGSSSPALFALGATPSAGASPASTMAHSTSLQNMTCRKRVGCRQTTEVWKRSCRRPNVKFCVGSSTSDFDSQDDRKTPTRTLTLSELPTEELEKTTEEENSDMDTDEAGKDTEQRGRQRDRSPEPDGIVSKIRSKSCPSLPTDSAVSQVNPNTRLQRSDSASAIMTKKTIIIDTICRNADGTVTLQQRKDLEARGTPETLRRFLQDQNSPNQPIPPAVPGANQAMVTYVQNQTCQAGSHQDRAFKYVKEKVVREIARQLGRGGLMVIRELGVTQDTIEQVSAAHPTDMVEKHLTLLRAWCTQAGCQANKDVLKRALEVGGRRDLVEMIDEMDPEIAQAEST